MAIIMAFFRKHGVGGPMRSQFRCQPLMGQVVPCEFYLCVAGALIEESVTEGSESLGCTASEIVTELMVLGCRVRHVAPTRPLGSRRSLVQVEALGTTRRRESWSPR